MAAGLLFIGITLTICSVVLLVISLGALKEKEVKHEETIKKLLEEVDESTKS